MNTHRFRATIAVLVAMALGAACSSGGSDAKGPSDFDPTVAAKRLRALDAIAIAGRGSYGTQSGPIAGKIAYHPYRYRTRVAISTGQSLGQSTIVRIGDRMWADRDPVTKLTRAIPLGIGALLLRGPAQPPYIPLGNPATPFTSFLAYPFEPALLLDRVAQTKAHFEAAGSSPVDGTARRRFHATLSVADARKIGVRAVTVWVDGHGVPVQLSMPTATQGRVRYRVRQFGGPVRVTAPPDAKIEDVNRPLPDATAPYTEVLSTTAAGIPIRVLMAPADLGWTCWKVESDPPFRGANETRPSGGTCAVPIEPTDLPDDQYAIPLGTQPDMPYILFGMVVPPGSTVEFERFGAAPVTVTALPSGLALYAGPPDQVLGLATVHTPQTTFVCGPGEINNQADFDAHQRDGGTYADIKGAPWNCLGEDDANSLSG